MLKTASIVALDHTPWNGPWMNRQQILSRFGGRGWHVVYSHGRHAVWERHSASFKQSGWLPGFERCDNVVVDEPGKIFVRFPRCGIVDSFTLRRHAAHLRSKALEASGTLIALIYHPHFARYADLLNPDLRVFYLRDAYFAEPGWSQSDHAHLIALAQKADLIVASQLDMAKPIVDSHRGHILELPNAVDFEAFGGGRDLPEPEQIAHISKPRIGYAGRINRKVNLRLLLDLAQKRTEWSWVLVGPLGSLGSREKEAQWASLLRLRNVHWLGAKSTSELPAYTAAIDVHLLCYDVEAAPWTLYGSPLKLYECLAAGRPVICAPLKSVSAIEGVVRIAATQQQWETGIAETLELSGTDLTAKCQAIAKRNDWNARVDLLEQRLISLLEN